MFIPPQIEELGVVSAYDSRCKKDEPDCGLFLAHHTVRMPVCEFTWAIKRLEDLVRWVMEQYPSHEIARTDAGIIPTGDNGERVMFLAVHALTRMKTPND